MNQDYWPAQDWRSAPPEELGMDAARLAQLERAIEAHYASINGIVVVRHGYIACERYGRGFGPQDAHPLASVTKSFLSALIGIAVEDGLMADLDRPVVDFFPEHPVQESDFQKRAVTLRHLLTMTAPFAWQPGAKGLEPLDRLRRQPDWGRFLLDLLGRRGQAGRFQYSSASSHLLSIILTRASGLSAREFANRRLFASLGIAPIPDHEMKSFLQDDVFGKAGGGWAKDPQGYNTGGWGLSLSPRDMARFGLLYLNGGRWDGRQVVPERWVQESVAMNANGYGYQWWLRGEVFAASGYSGQHIFCAPAHDLVVTIVSRPAARWRDRWVLLEEHILPAVKR